MAERKVSDEEVYRAAEHAANRKGMPWSRTEYNATKAGEKNALWRNGATDAQLDMFDELVKAAPVLGGRFNNYSGD